MSKLTCEVIYLNPSDRPKKVEPLSFSKWSRGAKDTHILHSTLSKIDELATEYATYLQEFSAEEKAVEFTEYHNIGECGISTCSPLDYDTVEYLGKCQSDGDMFKAIKRGTFTIYYGNLNSGCY